MHKCDQASEKGPSGVYPFNPKAVLDHDPCISRSKNPISSDIDLPSGSIPVIGEDDLYQPNNTDSNTTICRDENRSFTAEEEIFFTKLGTLKDTICTIPSTYFLVKNLPS